MSDYTRTTRECTLDSLRPELATAVREHCQKYDLGDVEAAVLFCGETTSARQKKGWFGGRNETIHTGLIVTPKWLIWAAAKENEKPAVLSARLRDIEVLDYEKSPQYKLMADRGMMVNGRYTGATQIGSTFIGLGTETAAQKFRTVLQEAMDNQ